MKFKSYILLSCLGLGTMTFAGCDSFLDDQPRGYAIAETTDDYDGMFNTIEFMNMNMADYTFWLSDDIQLTPECITNLPSTVYDYKPNSILRAFQYKNDVYEVTESCSAWESCYKNVYTFNTIANGVMESADGTEAQKKAIRAEARVSRAWMHFILAQMFSKPYNKDYAETELTIPIVTEADSNQKNFTRATMKELYDFIVKEMEESCGDMPVRKEHRYRAYRQTCYTLLGKVYWMMGEYEKALEPLRIAYEASLSDNSTIHLVNYNELQEKYGYRELTPTEMSDEEGTTDAFLLPYTWANVEVFWIKQCTSFGGVYRWADGIVTYYLNPKYYSLFDEYDLRRNLIPTKDADGNPTPYPVGCIRDKTANYGAELAELYLLLAECEARVGSEDEARALLKEFRSYRVLTGHEDVPETVKTRDELIRFCLDEQHREFLGRVMRYYNLRRLWNDPLFQSEKPISHSDGTNTYTMTEDNLYLQLPESVLKWNESWR